MTRIKLEVAAVDDRAAHRIMQMILSDMFDGRSFAPQYSVSDLDGSCMCDVTHEDNGIERGMEVTP